MVNAPKNEERVVGIDPVVLEIAKNAYIAIPEEMGMALRRTAYSPNIKERMDASCAIFDDDGRLIAQAEHIPVHLGSMPLTLKRAIQTLDAQGSLKRLMEGDQFIVNDPYCGGSHLPDITVIRPILLGGRLLGYAVNRAHHADVGGIVPGSMGIGAKDLDDEGIVIRPTLLMRMGRMSKDIVRLISKGTRNKGERLGDLRAQVAANNLGARRFSELVRRNTLSAHKDFVDAIIAYSERLMKAGIRLIPEGTYIAADTIEGDGVSEDDVHIMVKVRVKDGRVVADFTGTDREVAGNINTPIGVTCSAVYYAVKCIAAPDAPPNAGCFTPISVLAPEGCLLNPRPPKAVAGGNVETSQRVVDVMFSALFSAMPRAGAAQSQGTMNNLIIGGPWGKGGKRVFTYYETIGGGEGARSDRDGSSAIHTNMTNTANTPIEALEATYPLRVEEYSIIRGSGGSGGHRGGDGIRRAIRVLVDGATLSILSDRRRVGPKGANGGLDGRPGHNFIIRGRGRIQLGSKVTVRLKRGDIVVVETPGGGGYGLVGHRVR